MKICMVGTGYVGLVSGTCFAEMGNDVICVDIDGAKIDKLNKGIVPIYEPGLDEMMKRNVEEGRMEFTTDIEKGIKNSRFVFIAVGTPPDEDGSADLQYVLSVARDVGKYMDSYKVVVDKSTVPVYTAQKVKKTIQQELEKRRYSCAFDVVSNPEFLKEGSAIEDFMKPDRIIIGIDNERVAVLMEELYDPFVKNNHPIIKMSVTSAEMTKYAANAFLATKISFMNMLASLCEKVGADVNDIRRGIGSDSRIGYQFLYAGIGYGGSCFPKDVQALMRTFRHHDVQPVILEAVENINARQKKVLAQKIINYFDGDLSGRTIAIWGLSFKPRTDDMRKAPSLVIIPELIKKGAKIRAYDPEAMKEARWRLAEYEKDITYCSNNYETVKNADAMALLTEWSLFRKPDFKRMQELMKHAVIFDGRNQYIPMEVKEFGFDYFSIGR